MARVVARYPKTGLHQYFWRKDEIWRKSILKEMLRVMKRDSTCGIPYMNLVNPRVNGELVDQFPDMMVNLAYDRLELLAKVELRGMSALEMVRIGATDPKRVFVKNEPHTSAKAAEDRWRLIKNLSFVDQLVERVCYGPQNQEEIDQWINIPSSPGIGFDDDSQLELLELAMPIEPGYPVAETDISAWDWSVKPWLFRAEAEMRISLCSDNSPEFNRIVRNLVEATLLTLSVLSDGTIVEQLKPGGMPSGSYCTSSSNSRMRVLLAYLVADSAGLGRDPLVRAMGDDCIEEPIPGAQDRYNQLGFLTKLYSVNTTGFEFCSHYFQVSQFEDGELHYGYGIPRNWSRTLYRLIDKPYSQEFYEQFCSEMRHHPHLDVMIRILQAIPNWYKPEQIG